MADPIIMAIILPLIPIPIPTVEGHLEVTIHTVEDRTDVAVAVLTRSRVCLSIPPGACIGNIQEHDSHLTSSFCPAILHCRR